MITREKLIEVWMDCTWTDTPEEFEELILEWLSTHYYSDVIEYLQNIITKLELSFWIEELIDWWTIAYYESNKRIIHIWDMSMSYDSIDELLNELNEFESLVPKS